MLLFATRMCLLAICVAASAPAALQAEEAAAGPIEPAKYAQFYAELLKEFEQAKVSAFRIGSADGADQADKAPKLYQWLILEEKDLDGKKEKKLRELLSESKNFGREWAGCFKPGFAFRFQKDKEQVDLLFCLQCNYVEYHRGEKAVRWPLSSDGHNKWMDVYKSLFKPAKEKQKDE